MRIDTEPSIQELKDEIDDLRRQRDYLDKVASGDGMQKMLSEQITSIQSKLRELYDEDY